MEGASVELTQEAAVSKLVLWRLCDLSSGPQKSRFVELFSMILLMNPFDSRQDRCCFMCKGIGVGTEILFALRPGVRSTVAGSLTLSAKHPMTLFNTYEL